jgi:threonine/homoserine/homoserine lactone efflux protein
VGRLIGDLLSLALVVAISPVPIVAVLLMLLTPKARGTSAGFLAGWLVGIAGITTIVLLLAEDPDPGSSRSSVSAWWLELVLGVLLLVLAVRQWRSRPKPGEVPAVPRWLAAADQFTVARAGGLGLVLSAANPKALLVCIAAGATIAAADLDGARATWSVIGFTVVASSTVWMPVLAYAVGGARGTPALESLRRWLTVRGAVVTAALAVVIGLVLIAQGLSGLR